jgi:hypothetical protein
MKSKLLLTLIAVLALLLVWVPSASAKVKWTYGNGQADVAVDLAPGTLGAVCGTSITGFAGEGTDVDPDVTPPPAPSATGLGVELYITPASQDVGGATVVSGGLLLNDGTTLVPPLQTVTTSPPTAIDPLDNEYFDFQGNSIWEYSQAPFTFSIPGGTPPYANVVVRQIGRSAYFTAIAADCTTTTLTSSTNPSGSGESVSFTATVRTDREAAVTQGGVQFVVDGTPVAANVLLNASGQAVFTASWLTPGSHVVTANYLGAQSYQEYYFATSSGSLTQVVNSTSGDSTPPTIDGVLAPANPGNDGWYRTPVTLTWSVADAESPGSVVETGCVDQAISSDQAKTAYSCSATSDGGSSGPRTVTIGYDATAPTLAPSLPAGSSFAVGQPAPALSPGAQDATSGVASQSCTAVDTSTVGARSVTCTATDNAGNSASVSRRYTVTDAFLGFTNPPSGSVLGRGWTIPVKFSLGSYQGAPRTASAAVRVTASPTATTTAWSTSCTCKAGSGGYVCWLRLPGKPGDYQLRVSQNVGTVAKPRFVVVQNAEAVVGAPNANPLSITIR